MEQPTAARSADRRHGESAAELAWRVVLAAARTTARAAQSGHEAAYATSDDNELRQVAPADPDAILAWRPDLGWEPLLPADDARRALLDLYLPICSAATPRPTTIAHLGQSLDGFIATHAGESQWITGEENILHLHRLRALCDADVVGAGTVAADDPQLTTRLVSGSNPLRVVLDPMRRLGDHYRIFQDDAAETLYVCGRSFKRSDERRFGRATVVDVADTPDGPDVAELVALLRQRGCSRILVEGGGVTVSMFFEANLLDRLHLAVAPLFIGDGRPAIRLSPRALGECPRPPYRVFRMGADVLFDFDLRSSAERAGGQLDSSPTVTRII